MSICTHAAQFDVFMATECRCRRICKSRHVGLYVQDSSSHLQAPFTVNPILELTTWCRKAASLHQPPMQPPQFLQATHGSLRVVPAPLPKCQPAGIREIHTTLDNTVATALSVIQATRSQKMIHQIFDGISCLFWVR